MFHHAQEARLLVDHVCVIGLGVTGRVLARRLLGGGVEVSVYDGDPWKMAALAAAGATPARIPADAAEPADVAFVDVPDEAVVEQVLFDCGGVGDTLRDGGVVVVTCPVGSAFLRSAADRLDALGLRTVEAWFTDPQRSDERGDPSAAVLVSCRRAELERIAPVLERVGGEVMHTGPVGSVGALRRLGTALRAVPRDRLPEGRAGAGHPVLDPRQVLQALAGAASSGAAEEPPTGRRDGPRTAALAEALAAVWWAVRDAVHDGVTLTAVESTAAALLGGPGDGGAGRADRARPEAREPVLELRPLARSAAPMPRLRSGEAGPPPRRPSEPRTTAGVFSLQELEAAIDAATGGDRPAGDGPSAGGQGPGGIANCLGLKPEVFAGVIAEVERRCCIPLLQQAHGCGTPAEFVALVNTQLTSGV
jgi:3-hydroxyisobutyrate dehydrogenase-like beta-hydroxyacid dehydrogenase